MEYLERWGLVFSCFGLCSCFLDNPGEGGEDADPMEMPCPAAKFWNLWLARSLACSLAPARPPHSPLCPNPFKQGSLLPPAGPLGSAPPTQRHRAAGGETPPPPYCTCPAEVRARNFAEPLLPVSPRLSLLFPLPGERTSGGTSPESWTATSET